MNLIIFIHDDQTGRFEDAHGAADTGLGKIQFGGNIDGADRTIFLFEHQDGFQVVFTGFLYFQGNPSPFTVGWGDSVEGRCGMTRNVFYYLYRIIPDFTLLF